MCGILLCNNIYLLIIRILHSALGESFVLSIDTHKDYLHSLFTALVFIFKINIFRSYFGATIYFRTRNQSVICWVFSPPLMYTIKFDDDHGEFSPSITFREIHMQIENHVCSSCINERRYSFNHHKIKQENFCVELGKNE